MRQPQPLPDTERQPARMLVVDDNDVNRTLLQRMFQGQGYVIDTAANGQQALEALARTPYDIVLLDIMMPVMNGLDALQHIRANPTTAELPVVLISAMSEVSDIVRGLEMGANDYITKPIEVDVALARVRTHLTLKLLLDERDETIRRMAEAQQMREQFFRMASHDLKGPLTNLRVAHTLLKDIAGTDERAARVLDTMRVTLASMNAVVADFLDSAALQSGQLDLKLAAVEVAALLRETLGTQTAYAHEKDILLDVGPVDGWVRCDRNRTVQVLANLVNNAIKYSPPGSRVEVWAQHSHDNGAVTVFVADEGPGIPPAERVRLFQPFGTLSTEPTAGESRHGLGLWIAKHLIDLQGGEVGVECPAGGGSVFWVTLPAARA